MHVDRRRHSEIEHLADDIRRLKIELRAGKGRALGCYGHVIELRRTRVGPFSVEAGVPLDRLPDDADLMARAILPLQAGLGEIPIVPVDRSAAATLRRGEKLLLRGLAPAQGRAYVECFGTPIAFGVVEDGYFVSTRVFNLRG